MYLFQNICSMPGEGGVFLVGGQVCVILFSFIGASH